MAKIFEWKRWQLNTKLSLVLSLFFGILLIAASIFGFWYGELLHGQKLSFFGLWAKLAPGVMLFFSAVAIWLALAILLSALITKKLIKKPLLQLQGAAEKIALGELNFEIKPLNYDELGELTASFNASIAQLKQMIEMAKNSSALLGGLQFNVEKEIPKVIAGIQKSRSAIEELADIHENRSKMKYRITKVLDDQNTIISQLQELVKIETDFRKSSIAVVQVLKELNGAYTEQSVSQQLNLERLAELTESVREMENQVNKLNLHVLEMVDKDQRAESIYYQLEDLTKSIHRLKNPLQKAGSTAQEIAASYRSSQEQLANGMKTADCLAQQYQQIFSAFNKAERLSQEAKKMTGELKSLADLGERDNGLVFEKAQELGQLLQEDKISVETVKEMLAKQKIDLQNFEDLISQFKTKEIRIQKKETLLKRNTIGEELCT